MQSRYQHVRCTHIQEYKIYGYAILTWLCAPVHRSFAIDLEKSASNVAADKECIQNGCNR
jgi:hypothetical protein